MTQEVSSQEALSRSERTFARYGAESIPDLEAAEIIGGQTVFCSDEGQVNTLTADVEEGCDDP